MCFAPCLEGKYCVLSAESLEELGLVDRNSRHFLDRLQNVGGIQRQMRESLGGGLMRPWSVRVRPKLLGGLESPAHPKH